MQDDEFFIIESDRLDEIKNRLYGYIITENTIHTGEIPENRLTGNGAYVNIVCDDNTITITQDNMGSYGLYIYRENDRYAISNSFARLINHVKEKHTLTLNTEYLANFLTTKQHCSFDEMAVNEITLIPKDTLIRINKNNREIAYHIEYTKKTLDIHSPELVQCIDQWYDRWINIIRNIIKEDSTITVNIDETLSSRIILSLIRNSNINSENIKITADNNESLIIRELSEITGYKIQNIHKESIKNIPLSIEKSYNTKLGTNNRINLHNPSQKTQYHINSTNPYGKSCETVEEEIEAYTDEAQYYSKHLAGTIQKFVMRNMHKLQKHLKEYNIYSQEFRQSLYEHTILRNTLKDNVEGYLSNIITLNPLLDTDLEKISADKQELYTLILQRYSPELLNITCSDIKINNEIIRKVGNISDSVPLKRQECPIIRSSQIFAQEKDDTNEDNEYDNLIRKIFFSNTFKHTFLKHYSNHLYNQIIKKYTEFNRYDTIELNPSIAVMKIIEDVEYSQKNSIKTEFGWLEKFITHKTPEEVPVQRNYLLNKYNTVRIDMKNEGSQSNQIKIYDNSDESSKLSVPNWFTNEKGVGVCLSSDKSEISFKIKCISEGKLKIDLRTLDIRDRNNKRFPIYIDYLSFKVDGQEILKENRLIWHDKPIHYSKKVYNKEIISISIKWRPFSKISKYEL
ncbi:hypothetical protein PXD04_07040 [Methanosphaera sp. ISO3-F5]|uniref:hypothetical protein n=1 Tax=Methanosphaera sp. ISO3-F5 TaxID=1452353 RepID=UPI002B2638C4|nr:hypothetical protein [Methanosphaera sp. ISO3-F5]WQH63459.1 hypothetical protein PXD04_07040 [Methanosphaera sp. ISO3-F5]